MQTYFTRQTPPEPAADEAVIWRHTGEGVKLDKFMSAADRKRKDRFWRIIAVAVCGGVILFWVFNFDSVDMDFLPRFALELIVMVLLAWGGSSLLKKYFGPSGPVELPRVVTPVWMSHTRLGLIANEIGTPTLLDVHDIKSIENDYIMGSPALVVQTPTLTLNFVSSELKQISKHLVKLRAEST